MFSWNSQFCDNNEQNFAYSSFTNWLELGVKFCHEIMNYDLRSSQVFLRIVSHCEHVESNFWKFPASSLVWLLFSRPGDNCLCWWRNFFFSSIDFPDIRAWKFVRHFSMLHLFINLHFSIFAMSWDMKVGKWEKIRKLGKKWKTNEADSKGSFAVCGRSWVLAAIASLRWRGTSRKVSCLLFFFLLLTHSSLRHQLVELFRSTFFFFSSFFSILQWLTLAEKKRKCWYWHTKNVFFSPLPSSWCVTEQHKVNGWGRKFLTFFSRLQVPFLCETFESPDGVDCETTQYVDKYHAFEIFFLSFPHTNLAVAGVVVDDDIVMSSGWRTLEKETKEMNSIQLSERLYQHTKNSVFHSAEAPRDRQKNCSQDQTARILPCWVSLALPFCLNLFDTHTCAERRKIRSMSKEI